MKDQCAAPNCSGDQTEPEPLFRFPLDPGRSKTWVEKCQRQDLVDKMPEQLYRHYRLCAKHFDSAAFDGESQRTALKDEAIPTVFDTSSQPASGQVKRSNEMTKENEVKTKGRKRAKKSQEDPVNEEPNQITLTAEEEHKEYLKTLFEVIVLLGEQSIPPTGPAQGKAENLESSNLQAVLDHRMSCGDTVLKKRYEETKECCSLEHLQQIIEVCEKSVRSKVIEEVKQNGFFSVLTDELVKISGQWYLPVFLRFVDQSNYQRERFAGFLAFNRDDQAERMLSELTEEWGLDLAQCRGQAHSFSGSHFSQIKAFATKLMENNPKAVLTLRSTRTLNESLASSMPSSGVQLVLSTLKKIESFFGQSSQLQQEFEHAIFISYPDKEEKVKELKESCQSNWTRGHDAFEVAVEILEALLLCIDSMHDNEDMRWTDQVTNDALDISKALTDFEFVMTLVVLKNVTTLTRAFGKNLQGSAAEVRLAADSVKGVLQSLKEVSDNIDVYHEFWNDEAVTLATAMEIPVKVPRSYLRKNRSEGEILGVEKYYKEHLSVPVVKHFISELNQLFSEDHLKNLKGLSLVPTVIEQNKSTQPEEECVQVFNEDIPNAANLSAELHCWWVKWSKRGKGETFSCSLQETLQLADVKFFPNMLAVLRRVSVLPTLALEESSDLAYKRFRMYMEKTPEAFKSKSLALLNMNSDYVLELDSAVEMYLKTYADQQEGS
ncbi:THAP domain containing 12a [Gouania willdenowi]|uniref:52 kDa repressor of the inhibitor of the protein kinase-like n=1 Tax=Gouania willdenowi TaxID=441366 RepID=A0A8C5EXG5_GOUWI|nr:52 kDa repressor of the inhibitor of the protein kinase-like [Gouania willdenowi]